MDILAVARKHILHSVHEDIAHGNMLQRHICAPIKTISAVALTALIGVGQIFYTAKHLADSLLHLRLRQGGRLLIQDIKLISGSFFFIGCGVIAAAVALIVPNVLGILHAEEEETSKSAHDEAIAFAEQQLRLYTAPVVGLQESVDSKVYKLIMIHRKLYHGIKDHLISREGFRYGINPSIEKEVDACIKISYAIGYYGVENLKTSKMDPYDYALALHQETPPQKHPLFLMSRWYHCIRLAYTPYNEDSYANGCWKLPQDFEDQFSKPKTKPFRWKELYALHCARILPYSNESDDLLRVKREKSCWEQFYSKLTRIEEPLVPGGGRGVDYFLGN